MKPTLEIVELERCMVPVQVLARGFSDEEDVDEGQFEEEQRRLLRGLLKAWA